MLARMKVAGRYHLLGEFHELVNFGCDNAGNIDDYISPKFEISFSPLWHV